MSGPVCSHEQVAEIGGCSDLTSNDPCVVYWRSIEARQHPERAFCLECNGLRAYPTNAPQTSRNIYEAVSQ